MLQTLCLLLVSFLELQRSRMDGGGNEQECAGEIGVNHLVFSLLKIIIGNP